jgi:hypothetical protein
MVSKMHFKVPHNSSSFMLTPWREHYLCVKHVFSPAIYKASATSYGIHRHAWGFCLHSLEIFLGVGNPDRYRNNCYNKHHCKHWLHNWKRNHVVRNCGTEKNNSQLKYTKCWVRQQYKSCMKKTRKETWMSQASQ